MKSRFLALSSCFRVALGLGGVVLAVGLSVGLSVGMVASCKLEPLACPPGATVGCGGGGASGPYRLTAPVDVRRDDRGMVHVYGATDGDVSYASGYAQAEDRLFQMELQKRRAQGRLSEVYGNGRFDDDRIVRMIGIPTLGKDNAANLKAVAPKDHALVDAWVEGVNRRIAEVTSGAASLPTGFTEMGFAPEPWTVDDAMAVGKLIVFGNGSQLEFDALATLIHEFDPELYAKITFFQPLEQAFVLETTAKPLSKESPLDGSSSADRARLSMSMPPDAKQRLAKFLDTMSRFHPGASNNFAVDGRHTENGASMIAGDPHQGLRSPSLMWMSHMNSADAGGSLDVAGWSFVGTPGVSLGHNRDIAWTATTNYPDVTDIFDVVVDDAGNVDIGGESIKVVAHEESILVKDQGPQPVTVEQIPGVGVLLPNDLFPLPLVGSGHRVMLAWTGFRPTNEARAFAAIDRAKDVDEFDAAVDLFELGSFNFVAASKDAITYRSSPLVPDRGDPATHAPAYELLDAADPSTRWTGAFLTGDQLPHSRAEASGVIVTANNDPFGLTGNGQLVDDPFYFGAYFDPGLRASRIQASLQERAADHPLTLEDMQETQSDVRSLLAVELLGLLDGAWAKVPIDDAFIAYRDRPELDALVAMLAGWDRRMSREQAAPVAFEAFMYFLTRDILADDMGAFFEPVLGQEPIYCIKFALLALRDPASALLQGGRDALVLAALDQAATFLVTRFGSTTTGFLWKDFHQTSFPSESIAAFDGGSVPTDGAEGTVNVSSGAFFDGDAVRDHHVSSGGAIYRMVATFDDTGRVRAKFNMPRGNAAEPSSPYYNDRTDDWAKGTYADLLFDDAEIEAHTNERKTLSP